jgi:hypothetical protein
VVRDRCVHSFPSTSSININIFTAVACFEIGASIAMIDGGSGD